MDHGEGTRDELRFVRLEVPNQVPPHRLRREGGDLLSALPYAILTEVWQARGKRRTHGVKPMPLGDRDDADRSCDPFDRLHLRDLIAHSLQIPRQRIQTHNL
jgi:hypothetical protein